MAFVCAGLACLFMGAAAGLFVVMWQKKPTGVPLSRKKHFREALCSLMELLGHTPFIIKLSRSTVIKPYVKQMTEILQQYGLTFSHFGCTAFCVAACVVSALLGGVLSNSLLGVAVGIIVWIAVLGSLAKRYANSKAKREAEQMPQVLRALSASLSAGKSIQQAIEYVGMHLSDPFGREFLQASFEIRGGCTVEEAVNALSDRVGAPGCALLATALSISQKTGSPLEELFESTSRMVSASVSLQKELEVKTSQARLSARVVSIIPFILMGLLTLISPDYRAGLMTSAGAVCICLSVLLDSLALVILRVLMARSIL